MLGPDAIETNIAAFMSSGASGYIFMKIVEWAAEKKLRVYTQRVSKSVYWLSSERIVHGVVSAIGAEEVLRRYQFSPFHRHRINFPPMHFRHFLINSASLKTMDGWITCAKCTVFSIAVPQLAFRPSHSAPGTHLLDWPFPVSADVLNQINQSADPCEDFYEFACGGWMSRNPLTANESSVSGFTALNDDNMEALKTALEQAATNYSQVGYDCFTVRPNIRSSYNVQETQENRKYAFLSCGHLDFESTVIAQNEESKCIRWPGLSLPRVINFKFLLQPYQRYYITQYEEFGFS